jgi:hypothetical protein
MRAKLAYCRWMVKCALLFVPWMVVWWATVLWTVAWDCEMRYRAEHPDEVGWFGAFMWPIWKAVEYYWRAVWAYYDWRLRRGK